MTKLAESKKIIQQRLRDMLEQMRTRYVRPWWTVLALTLLSLWVVLPTLWLTTRAYASLLDAPIWESYFQNPLILLVNLLPPLVVLWGLTLLSKRPWVGYLGMTGVSLALSLGNYFKISLRGDPVILTDLGLLGDAALIMGEYSLDVTQSVWFVLLCALVGLALTVALLPTTLSLSRKKSLVGFGCVVVAGFGLFFGVYTSGVVYDMTENEEHISRWSE